MHLAIVRHGKAEEESESGRDVDRRLTARGVRQAQHVGEHLAARAVRPRALFCSRAARAAETGAIIARCLGLTPRHDDRLLVDAPVGPVLDLLREAASEMEDEAARPPASVVIVGHNPQLSHLAGLLLIGPAGPGVELRTGECHLLRLDVDAPIGGGEAEGSLRLD